MVKWRIAAALFAVIGLAAGAFGQTPADKPFAASVRVTGKVLNVVRPELFGDNIEWTNDGMGFWRPSKGDLDPELTAQALPLGVTHLRYPGGTLSDYFHWQWAVGKDRKPIPNPFDKGAPAYPAFGPDEFMALCRRLHTRASITINAGTGTPEEAAAWVAYHHARKDPVIDYEIGNEIYLADPAKEQIPDLPIAKNAQQYAEFYTRCWTAIQKAAPGTRIGASAPGVTGLPAHTQWTEDVLRALDGKIDYLAVHNAYEPGARVIGFDANARVSDEDLGMCLMASPLFVAKNLDATCDLITRCCPKDGKRISLHVTESGPLVYSLDTVHALEDVTWNRTLAAAIYQAGLFNVLARNPKVTSANHLPLCQDIFGASIGIHQDGAVRRVWRNAVYYVFQLYARQAGRRMVASEVHAPAFDTSAVCFVPAQWDVPLIDSGVFRARNGALTVMLINRSLTHPASLTLNPNLRRYRIVRVTTLASESFKDKNGPDDPMRIAPVVKLGPATVQKKPFVLALPKCSLTCVEIAPQ